jgi:hypothetical protein
MSKQQFSFTYKGETQDVGEEYHKYIHTMMDNTKEFQDKDKEVATFFHGYIYTYQKAMNKFMNVMERIEEKLTLLHEKRIVGQSVQEFSMELIMLHKEFQIYYSVMYPVKKFIEIIRPKDTEVFDKGYKDINNRVDKVMESILKVLTK